MALRKEEFYYDPHKEKKSMDNAKSTKRHIAINVSSELEARIVAAAEQQKLSINQYLESVLEEFIRALPDVKYVRKPVALENVAKLMQMRDRILQEHGGVPFANSIELLRQEREERERELDQRYNNE